MHVDIITPDTNLYSGYASYVGVPGLEGSLGILENHAPIISVLKKGVVELKTNEGEKQFKVNGGVLEMQNNRVVILAE